MKDYKRLTFFLIIALVVLSFNACEKLKIDNLKANAALKEGNKHYQEEKFRKAIKSYKEALELNPNLEFVNFYLGTSYASLFKPGKIDKSNQENGKLAEEYLLKTREQQPDNQKVVMALGELYNKLSMSAKASGEENAEAEAEKYFKKAEKAYLELMKKAKSNPNTYYILANFYIGHGKYDIAEEVYKKRINLNIKESDGYLYYAKYLQDKNDWDGAIKNYEYRALAIAKPDILDKIKEKDEVADKVEQIQKKRDFIDKNLKKSKALKKEDKKLMIAEKEKEIKEIGNIDELKTDLAQKEENIKKELDNISENIKALDKEKQKKVAQSYYSMGVCAWYKAFKSSPEMMSGKERMAVNEQAMNYLNKAAEFNPEDPAIYMYKNLAYRQMAIAEPLKQADYMAKAEEEATKAKRLYRKIAKAEALKKQIAEMGGAEE